MKHDDHISSSLVDILLFYVRFRYLSASEGLAYLFLAGLADQHDSGYVDYAQMSELFGHSKNRCRSYVYRLRRYGLIEGARSDGHGGACYKPSIPMEGADGQQCSVDAPANSQLMIELTR